jgi:type VI secretion system protein ImpM
LQPRSSEVPDLEELPEGGVLIRGVDRRLSLAFLAARRFGHRRIFASQSFWWTIGGEDFPPLALSLVGLPVATRFADMLTGAFVNAHTTAEGGAA